MKMNPDDPKLTAYALGELPAAEKAAVEAELQTNAECRQAVEEIRQAAGLLSEKLAAEPCPKLRPDQRAEINARLEPSNIFFLPRQRWFATAGFAALAACVMAIVSWQLWFTGDNKPGNNLVEHGQKVSTPVQLANNPVVTKPETATAPAPTRVEPEISSSGAITVSAPPAAPTRAAVNAPAVIAANSITPATAMTPPPTAPVAAPVTKAEPQKADESNDQKAGSVTMSFANSQANANAADATAHRYALAGDASLQKDAVVKRAEEYRSAQPGTTVAQSGVLVAGGTTFDSQNGQINSSQSSAARGRRGGGGAISSGAIGGGGGRGMGGGGAGGGGPAFSGRVGPVVQNRVVVTETRTTTLYDGDPYRDNFTTWRYYRWPTPLPPPPAIEAYSPYADNAFYPVMHHPLSTFSVDVDTASYANIRRFLNAGQMPPRDAVRVEEMVNYFKYRYPAPKGEDPFAATIEVAGCPWEPDHRLVRVGIKAKEIARDKRPPSNFVFLIDISGSMSPSERLPLIKQALRQLVSKMSAQDRVAIVVYASEAGVRLASTPCSEKEKIMAAIDSLAAGGSTNGGDGIQQAYRVARENMIEGGVNRVLLATDGDFNVGMTDQNELIRMIQDKAKSGVYLTTLGVGTDNYKDALMQKLADRGNGNYHYLDTLEEAQKVLIDQMSGTLVTVAKDVKLQVEFNPSQVNAYRLIGYEKRALRTEDFNNDAKDAGEIGAGHTVTALYEVVPVGKEIRPSVDTLKYTTPSAAAEPQRVIGANSKELLTLKLRYKHPDGDVSRMLEFPVTDGGVAFGKASEDFKFAAAVVSFGLLLRDSAHKGSASYSTVLELAGESKGGGDDDAGYRDEFITLVKKAQALSDRGQIRR